MEKFGKNLKTAAIGLAITGVSCATAFFLISSGLGLKPSLKELAEHSVRTPAAVNWVPFGSSALESNSKNKPIFIFFTTEKNHLCRLLETEVLADSRVVEILNKSYVPVHIVYSDSLPETSQERIICRTYRIRSFPTILITDFRGNVIAGLEKFQSKDVTIKFIEESCKNPKPSTIPAQREAAPAPSSSAAKETDLSLSKEN